MKVLIAEDDQDQLALRCMLLSRSGFEILAAADAPHAMELAAANKPECAIVDLGLPTEELGLQLLRDLKKIDPAMHLVVLTGGNAQRLTATPENRLIDRVFTKGSPSGALIRVLNELTALRRTARS